MGQRGARVCGGAGLFDRRFADICSENLERNARFHVVQEFHQADGDRISFLARGAPGHPDPDGILGPSILNQRGEYPLLQFLEDRWFPKECGDGDKTALAQGVGFLPQFQFGTVSGGSSMNFTRVNTTAGNYENFNPIWTYTDNLSKVVGKHSFKFGGYLENNHKIQPSGPAYSGSFNFSPDALNGVNNTGNGYANGLLGYVDSYQQATGRAVFNAKYWNAEFYLQDNWRVTSRLTLDIGVRFYHQTPQEDINKTFSNFVPGNYTKAAAPRLYIPGMSAGKRVAIDPGTGTVAPVAYIGLYVPNSGNPADGFQVLGSNGVSLAPFNQSPVAVAPRFGFAYDLTGDGKTALRGGFGIFYNRLDGNQVYN